MRPRGLLVACAAVLAVLAASGCGTPGLAESTEGDAQRGKELFVERCGSCHVLADAGTRGTIGPDLDAAFAQSRVDGLGEDTIRSVVRGQIAYPVEEPPTGATGMPADLVVGEDAESVSRYVAAVAGRPGQSAGPGAVPSGEEGEAASGASIWQEAGCGGCHTLDAAGSSGTVGPNLDDSKPSRELTIDRVTNGRGAMPAFKDSYSEEQIAAVADYVVASTGG